MANQYFDAIRGAKVIGSSDRGPEFQQCIKGWESRRSQRNSLYDEMSNRGVFSSQAYVILEVGSAGWGIYHYAYLWIEDNAGYMTTDMVGRKWGKRYDRSFRAERLMGLLNDAVDLEKPIVGSINTSVDDGPCFFVTIQHRGRLDQFAVYAPRREEKTIEKSEAIVNQLRDFIDSYTQ